MEIRYDQGFPQAGFPPGFCPRVRPGGETRGGGLGGVPPRPDKNINSKVSETNFGDSRLPVC